ncbi:MAG: LacI family transcriptional regulator [Hyphomicrobiales bacterium]|nr:MAG: LacI family transcriptional regulator [Hyphomicrobiales bacterium]
MTAPAPALAPVSNLALSRAVPAASFFWAVYETGLPARFNIVLPGGLKRLSDRLKITIRDVARAAGVSVTSVSRHLNGRISLPDPTALKIEQAAARLGYRPNAIARRLTRGSSETLGLITSDIAYPLFAAIASASEAEAARHGYNLLMLNSRNLVDHELAFLARIEDHQVDGILLLTNHSDDGRLVKCINRTGGVVLLDEDVPGARAPRLFARNADGARMATRHLIEKGHRRIGAIAGPHGLLSTTERLSGYARALEAAGIVLDDRLVVHCDYDEGQAVGAFKALFEQPDPPTAVFTCGDMLALGAMRAARAMGLRIPEDVSLIGFDDISNADLLSPALTTVRQSPAEFGRRGVALLLDLITGRKTEAVTERIGVDLVVRASVAPPSDHRIRWSGTNTGSEPPTGGQAPAREEVTET